jgi:hypothetical protein
VQVKKVKRLKQKVYGQGDDNKDYYIDGRTGG